MRTSAVALLPSVVSSVFTDRAAEAATAATAGLPPDVAARAVGAASESVAGAAAVADRLATAGAALRTVGYDAFTDGMSLVFLLCAAAALLAALLVRLLLPRTAEPGPPPPPSPLREPVPGAR